MAPHGQQVTAGRWAALVSLALLSPAKKKAAFEGLMTLFYFFPKNFLLKNLRPRERICCSFETRKSVLNPTYMLIQVK
jgi:hypothetical protein